MNKKELIEMLAKLNIPLNEGQTSQQNTSKYPRIVFWDYVWSDVIASNGSYAEKETYQISFYAKTPRHEKIIELKQLLKDYKIFTDIFHEFVEEDAVFHSYLSIEIIVDSSTVKNND